MILRLLLPIAATGLLLGACGGDDSSDGEGPTTGLKGEITVAAAASLTDAFTDLGEQFEGANPGTTVDFTFDSSGTLAAQIREGAPSDAFASADEETMDALIADGFIEGEAEVFASNELVIVTQPGNPAGVTGLADLAELPIVALCVDTAPCGSLTVRALTEREVALDASRVTEGQNARATLGAVTEGDADAALVYASDAEAAGDDVSVVELDTDAPIVTRYPIALVAGGGDPDLARAFIAFVTSPDGREVLDDHGFLSP